MSTLLFAACTSPTDNTARSTVPPSVSSVSTVTLPVTSTDTDPTAAIDYVAYVEEALDFAVTSFYRTDEVDWDPIRKDALDLVHSSPTAETAYSAIERILIALYPLSDTHTFFLRPHEVAKSAEMQVNPTRAPSGRRLDGDIGYLNVPTTAGNAESSTYASQLRGLMEAIDSERPVCGWIIDIRDYEGGNAYVGWAGIAPLLGEGAFIRFPDNSGTVEVEYKDGRLLYDGEPLDHGAPDPSPLFVPDGYVPHNPGAPVAVLTSWLTASAGEATLVSFLGRPSTRSFGEPTFGIPTGPLVLELPDGAQLWITGARYQDRLGRIYNSNIRPDEVVVSRPAANGDPVVEAATEWILGTEECTTAN